MNVKRSARILVAAAWLAFGGAAQAAQWVIVDLIGHQLTTVRAAAMTTGSNVDRNQYDTTPLADDALSDAVIRATTLAIKAAERSAQVSRMTLSATERASLLDQVDGATTVNAPRLVALAAGKAGAKARFVVVSPYRSEFRLQSATYAGSDTSIGHGKAAGLGFYLDRSTPFGVGGGSAVRGRGFLGLFAHARVAVIDAATGETLAERSFASGTTFAAAAADDEDPWKALPENQKLGQLVNVYGREARRVVAEMLALPRVVVGEAVLPTPGP